MKALIITTALATLIGCGQTYTSSEPTGTTNGTPDVPDAIPGVTASDAAPPIDAANMREGRRNGAK